MSGEPWRQHVSASLSKRECPYSGLPLTRNGDAGPSAWSCGICDCFGYDLDDPRIGATQ